MYDPAKVHEDSKYGSWDISQESGCDTYRDKKQPFDDSSLYSQKLRAKN